MVIEKSSLAIIGCGNAGVAAFIAAVRRRAASTIFVIGPQSAGPEDQRCRSYERAHDDAFVDVNHVASSRASNFLEHLCCGEDVAMCATYAPGIWTEHYLADRFSHYVRAAAENGIEVIQLPYRFKSLSVHGYRRYVVHFDDSVLPPVPANDVIICAGYEACLLPEVLEAHKHRVTFIGYPCIDSEVLARLPTKTNVLVIGNELAAVDAANLLVGRDHHVTLLCDQHIDRVATHNSGAMLRLMESGAMTFEKGAIRSAVPAYGDGHAWSIDWGKGHCQFGAVVAATGFYAPNLFFNERDELEIDADSRREKDSVSLTEDMAVSDGRWATQQSIWLVGEPVNVRLPVVNAMLAVTARADRVAAKILDCFRAVLSADEAPFV